SPGNPGITFGLFTWLRNTTFEKPGSMAPEPAAPAPVPAAAPARYAADAESTSAMATAIVLRGITPPSFAEGVIVRRANRNAQARARHRHTVSAMRPILGT